jgi:hypothetical protein
LGVTGAVVAFDFDEGALVVVGTVGDVGLIGAVVGEVTGAAVSRGVVGALVGVDTGGGMIGVT